MTEKDKDKELEYKYVKFSIDYNNKIISSMWLDLTNTEIYNLVLEISENGTNLIESFKLVLSENKFVVISREQLDVSLIEVEFSNRKTKPKTKPKTELIKG